MLWTLLIAQKRYGRDAVPGADPHNHFERRWFRRETDKHTRYQRGLRQTVREADYTMEDTRHPHSARPPTEWKNETGREVGDSKPIKLSPEIFRPSESRIPGNIQSPRYLLDQSSIERTRSTQADSDRKERTEFVSSSDN